MKKRRWLASIIFGLAVIALVNGVIFTWIGASLRRIEPGMLELPLVIFVSVECVVVGVVGLVAAHGMFTGRVWARRSLMVASGALAVVACVVVAVAPIVWVVQIALVLLCIAIFVDAHRWRPLEVAL